MILIIIISVIKYKTIEQSFNIDDIPNKNGIENIK